MTTIKRFEDLWVWQQARILVRDVYADFRKGQATKDFAFCDQVHRAALSVMSNVAEGFERRAQNDRARYFEIAKGSCGEVRSLYYVALDLEYLDASGTELRQTLARQISGGLSSLSAYLRQA
jgi:four helix bundle protein